LILLFKVLVFKFFDRGFYGPCFMVIMWGWSIDHSMSDQDHSHGDMGKTPQRGRIVAGILDSVKDDETCGSKPWITWFRQKSRGGWGCWCVWVFIFLVFLVFRLLFSRLLLLCMCLLLW